MPKVNFPKYENAEGFSTIPDGEYKVEVVKVDIRDTNAGDEMWGLHLKIIEGQFANRKLFDNMVFSSNPNCMKRVKHICSHLGIDVSAEVELEDDMLIGRKCIVETFIDEYKGESRSKVKFAGYKSLEPAKETKSTKAPVAQKAVQDAASRYDPPVEETPASGGKKSRRYTMPPKGDLAGAAQTANQGTPGSIPAVISSKQRTELFEKFTSLGLGSDDEGKGLMIGVVEEITGKDSTAGMTPQEFYSVMQILKAVKDGVELQTWLDIEREKREKSPPDKEALF
jgi:hypothetical protein